MKEAWNKPVNNGKEDTKCQTKRQPAMLSLGEELELQT